MNFSMLFTVSNLEQLVKNGKQMKKSTFCFFDVNAHQSKKNSCPAIDVMKHLCLFIVRSFLNHANYLRSPLYITLYDYQTCFDSLWLEECCNDLFEAGVKDDKIALIYKMNSKNQVAVKTPFGVSEQKTVERIVLQGENFGPLQCSVTVDTFGKECIEESKNLYMYKGQVGIPPLAMIDDVICPAVCGLKSIEVTAFINAKSNAKKNPIWSG